MNYPSILTLLFLSVFGFGQLTAQPNDCLLLESQEAGSVYESLSVGTVIGQEINQADLLYYPYRTPNGARSFGSIRVADINHPDLPDRLMVMNGANLGFDFVGNASGVCFWTNRVSGFINLGINGTTGVFESWEDPQITEVFPDLEYRVTPVSDSTYTICIFNLIEELVVGGFSLEIGDVCIGNANHCVTNNMFIQPECINRDTVALEIEFTPSDEVQNDFFDLYLDGEFAGFYSFEQLPITTSISLSQQQDGVVVVQVCENDNPECCYSQRVALPTCYQENCIGFEIASDAFFAAVRADDPSGLTFYEEQGASFSVTEMSLDGNPLPAPRLVRFGQGGSRAFTNGSFIVPGLQNAGTIMDFSEVEGRITQVNFDFYNYGGRGGGISFSANDLPPITLYAPFEPGTITYTLTDGVNTIDLFMTVDPSDPNLGSFAFLGEIETITFGGNDLMFDNVCFNREVCNTRITRIGQVNCVDPAGPPHFYLDLTGVPNPNGQFNLFINGDLYERFSYRALPLTNIVVDADPGEVLVFTIEDVGLMEECIVRESLTVQDCDEDCMRLGAEVIDFNCIRIGEPYLVVELSSPGAGQRVIITNSSNNFEQEAVYERSGIFISDPTQLSADTLFIYDPLVNCTAALPIEFFFGADECYSCEIDGLYGEVLACEEGEYDLQIGFNYPYEDGEFLVYIDGDLIGQYSLREFPLTIRTINTNGQIEHNLAIQEVNGFCEAGTFFSTNCIDGCEEFDATLVDVRCEGTDTVFVEIGLTGVVNEGQRFIIYDPVANFEVAAFLNPDNLLGFYVPSFLRQGTFVILDGLTGCRTRLPYAFDLDCNSCEISDMRLETVDCDENSFFARITFNGPIDEYFIAVSDFAFALEGNPREGFVIGPFDQDELPLTFVAGPIDNEGCRIRAILEEVDCNPCDISGMRLTVGDCSNANFHVWVRFDGPFGAYVLEVGNETFDVVGDPREGFFIGPFEYDQVPLTVVAYTQFGNCRISAVLEEVDCSPCEISDMRLTAAECTNTDFYMRVQFDGPRDAYELYVRDEVFTVEGDPRDGFIIGPFNYDYVPLTVVAGALTGDCQIFAVLRDVNCNPNCDISDLELTTVECDDGFFSVWVRFNGPFGEYLISESDQAFFVEGDPREGFQVGPFDNRELPLLIEVYQDPITTNCRLIGEVNELDCEPSCGEGRFNDIRLFCSDEGETFMTFTTIPGNTGSTEFQVIVLDQVYTFQHGQELYRVPIIGNPVPHNFTVTFREPNCSYERDLRNPCFCAIEDFVAEATPCDDNGQYYVEVSVSLDANWAGARFVLTLNNEEFLVGAGLFSERFGPFSEPQVLVTIREESSNQCIERTIVEQDCEPSCGEGRFNDIELFCSDQGIPILTFTTEPINNAATEFQVIVLNQVYTFQHGQGQYRVPIIGDFIPSSFVVTFREPNCSYEVEVRNPCFCAIEGLIAEATPCDASGQYFVEVSAFLGANWPNAQFEVTVHNEVFFVSAGQFTERFGPFSEPQVIITIREQNGRQCVERTIVEQDCEPQGCDITNIIAEAYRCDGEQFLVDVAFDNPGGGPLGYYIFGDGMIFGPFSYDERFVTIGPLSGAELEHDLLILDIADPSCFANYEFSYQCTYDCVINSVSAEAVCDGEVFYVSIDVDGRNTGQTFSLVGNGENYGTFSYEQLPLRLGPFEEDPGTELEFGVIDLENANCTNFTTVEAPNCRPCTIADLVYTIDCSEDGVYILNIEFSVDNPMSDRWLLLLDGEVYEGYPYSNTATSVILPLSRPISTIAVRDARDESCASETLEVGEIPCCALFGGRETVSISECNNDGSFYLEISELEGFNLSDSVSVTYAPAGSSIIETVTTTYAELPLSIGPLQNDGQVTYQVIVTDGSQNCAQSYSVTAEVCDNQSCVEFTEFDGIFGPLLGHPDGTIIYRENGVAVSYESHPTSECNCNVFGLNTASIPGVNFGNGQGIMTQESGFQLDFTRVNETFNTVNVDFYFPGGELAMRVNGEQLVTVTDLMDLPEAIASDVTLQVSFDANDSSLGMFTFSGFFEFIEIYTTVASAFDNVCMSQSDNVWPGDANSNGIADHFDLLNIGIAYGSTGPERTEVSDEWTSFIAPNWGDSFADGLNYKHADTNGDGEVGMADRQVLQANYGLSHRAVNAYQPLPYTDTDPPVVVDTDGLEALPANSAFEIPIVVGSEDTPMNDLYGMAFTVRLDPEIIDLSRIEVVFPVSWFGEENVNMITLYKLYDDGTLEVSLSRIDGNNVSGFGTVVAIRGFIDDIAGLSGETQVDIDQVYAIDLNEEVIPVRPGSGALLLTSTEEGIDMGYLKESFRIFPNPTSGQVHFRNAYQLPLDRLNIYTASGQMVQQYKKPNDTVDLSYLPAGIYFLQVHVQGQIFTERLVKTEN